MPRDPKEEKVVTSWSSLSPIASQAQGLTTTHDIQNRSRAQGSFKDVLEAATEQRVMLEAMSWSGRWFANDEELGKKNDDHRPNGPGSSNAWSARMTIPAMRKRSIIYIACAVLFLFLFIKNIPTDVGPHPRWADTRLFKGSAMEDGSAPSPTSSSSKKPPRPSKPSEQDEHYHDGPIKFYKLAASLHAATGLGGQKESNKNVLFAASSLKSVSELLPLACEMARWERNDVHLALMGRDDLNIQEIQKLNGATKEDCNINWHDARPDYSRWSSDFRMEASVSASLDHIQSFVHPQVILMDEPSRDDEFFVNAIRSKAQELLIRIIELPSNAIDTLMWIACLDSASLAAWQTTYVDIVIQAPSGSSGSIVRLLRSLESADYFGARRPHLTLELPAEVDPPTWKYLDNLIWPPMDDFGSPHVSQVSIRHRIPRITTSAEEASARLVESFYPKRTGDSHVLFLSPQVELSPLYYHYLFYSILEYKYSNHAEASKETKNVIGISLDLPSSYLNDTTDFTPPTKKRGSKLEKKGKGREEQSSFLWQSPNNNAALYFGDKWMEFHSFLSSRLTKGHSNSPKAVSEKHPAWLEFLTEFMRARGYAMLYPGQFHQDAGLTTVHDELYQIPEEFIKEHKISSNSIPPLSPDQALEGNSTSSIRNAAPSIEKPLLESSLTSLLPDQGDLLEVISMPLVSFDGHLLDFDSSNQAASQYAQQFIETIGDCKGVAKPPSRIPFKAIDLFCHQGEPYDFYAETKPPTAGMEANTQTQAEALPHDEDRISAANVQDAKAETASHIDRQAGAQSKSKDAGSEIKSKTAGEEKAKQPAIKTSGKAKEPGTEKSKMAEESEISQKPKPGDRPKSEGPHDKPPSHRAFDKAQPKPVNDVDDEAGGKRSPGW